MKQQILINENYKEKYGFYDLETSVFRTGKGLNKEVVEAISKHKKEPEWMLNLRLKALEEFNRRPVPLWGGDLSNINFDEITYYLDPSDVRTKSWEDLPDSIKKTFDKLGIPEAEKKFLGGVGGQYDSEVLYHKLREDLEKQGIIFMSTDEGLKKHESLLKQWFGKVIHYNDNKFAALNTAVWSGGSFIYVPPGVKVEVPLQAYFRINAKNVGQFERTLIIADKNSEVNYIEGCFTGGTVITTNPDYKTIESIIPGDKVLTHTGEYKQVTRTQIRPYSGCLYKLMVWGDSTKHLNVTEEHPFLCVRRQSYNERNKEWTKEWIRVKDLRKGDYLVMPINKVIKKNHHHAFKIKYKRKKMKKRIRLTKDFTRLIGYYLAEGSVSSNTCYLNFAFGEHERFYIDDVKKLLKRVFGIKKILEVKDKKKHGITVTVCSAVLARIFKEFGTRAYIKRIPEWLIFEDPKKQKELVKCFWRGDGNYYNKRHKSGLKQNFRISTTSMILARQIRDMLLRLGIVAFINKRMRVKERRKAMYTVGIGGEQMIKYGKIVGYKIDTELNNKKRPTMFYIDDNYAYLPIRSVFKNDILDEISVYNFSVEGDESYVANGMAVHNCSSPVYSSDSLHSAVVELVALEGAKIRYTTIQNWSSNVYNLVTKRAFAYKNASVYWLDANTGSRCTMKYPSVYMLEPGAKADILSIAFAGKDQHQDAGGKVVHYAPNTTSRIISKSISKDGGRTTYRGLLEVAKGATGVKSTTRCDALMLDEKSRSDTYPTMKINEQDATISHEAYVGKIGEEQLFYLMSRGLKEEEAMSMIILGFISEFTRELPMEYALEFNRLMQINMENSIG